MLRLCLCGLRDLVGRDWLQKVLCAAWVKRADHRAMDVSTAADREPILGKCVLSLGTLP